MSELLKVVGLAENALFRFGRASHHNHVDSLLGRPLEQVDQTHQSHRKTKAIQLVRLHLDFIVDCCSFKPRVDIGLPAWLFVEVLPHFWVELGHLRENLILVPAKGAHTFIRDQVLVVQHA